MKRILTILAIASAATGATAGGRYDGIYQNTLSDSTWISVHHSATHLVAAKFDSNLRFEGTTITSTLGSVSPSVLNTWGLLGGPFSGNQATVTGEIEHGACNIQVKATFTDTQIQIDVLSIAQTSLGRAGSYNCNALIQAPWPAIYKRIF